MSNSGRVTMHDGPDGLHILIVSKRDPNLVIFLVVVLALNFWFLSAGLRTGDLFSILLFLTILYLLGRAILWTLWGRESILLRGRIMTLRFDMPAIVRTRKFDVSNMGPLRTFKPPAVRFLGLFMMFPDHRGVITFDYNGRMHAFGVDLPQSEAEQVIRNIELYDFGRAAAKITADARV